MKIIKIFLELKKKGFLIKVYLTNEDKPEKLYELRSYKYQTSIKWLIL
ncbi:hypothetical protein QSS_3705 [Clostridioides difficile P33]|nr:hypothetical protein QSS_3705 [Clostridioides difficile P33]